MAIYDNILSNNEEEDIKESVISMFNDKSLKNKTGELYELLELCIAHYPPFLQTQKDQIKQSVVNIFQNSRDENPCHLSELLKIVHDKFRLSNIQKFSISRSISSNLQEGWQSESDIDGIASLMKEISKIHSKESLSYSRSR